FSVEELLARVRAHLRTPSHVESRTLLAGGIELDLLSRRVTVQGAPVALSAKEFELLAYFMRHAEIVLTRPQLLSAVWGYEFDPGSNVVEVYVGYLRRKLRTRDEPAPIQTVRSVGYRLTTR
ncbi:MAG: hypothetical protein QOJ85_1209, partial [Solirubrobacteraceae bacterium]|nr:hypothetical protein [Solirubrobacteraceae bacterium]